MSPAPGPDTPAPRPGGAAAPRLEVSKPVIERLIEPARVTRFEHADDPAGLPVKHDGRPRTLAFDATGIDRIEFLIAPNAGEATRARLVVAGAWLLWSQRRVGVGPAGLIVIGYLLVMGPWMVQLWLSYTQNLFVAIPDLIG